MKWSRLRIVGETWAGKATILIPVFGYLILNHQMLSSLAGRHLGAFDSIFLWLNLTKSIMFTYFGLCLLGIGVLVYQFVCPLVVKKYADENAYIKEEIDQTSSDFVSCLVGEIQEMSKGKNGLRENYSIYLDVSGVGKPLNGNTKANILRDFYGLHDESRSLFRAFVFLLYIIGFVLLSIPTVITFFRICRYMVS